VIDFDYRDAVPDHSICIFFLDTTYPINGDDTEVSESLKRIIQDELQCEIEEVDIWPGASLPAWLFQLDLTSLAISAGAMVLFFKGTAINENLDAWVELAQKIKIALTRKCYLNRSAAAALAIDEVLKLVGPSRPKRIILSKYKKADNRFENFHDATETDENVRIEYQGTVIHVFEFHVDEKEYLVVVDGRDVAVRCVDPTAEQA
jgi:hypothetical protein